MEKTSKQNTSNERFIASGITVSNDTRHTGLNNNDLIIGSSGSGKTGGYVVPNLLHPSESMVVSDTKGTLYNRFHDHLEKLGYDVQVIDFTNPEKSIGYNPLDYIRRRSDGSPYEVDIKTLATAIAPALDRNEPFWDKAANRWLCTLIGYVMEALPSKEHTLPKVCELQHAYRSGEAETLFREWCVENPNSYTTRKYQSMNQSREAEKMWNSIQEFVNEGLELFDYAEFRSIFEKNNIFRLESLTERKTVLFLNTSDNDPSFDKLTNIFHTQLLQVLIDEADKAGGELPIPVRIILDDFAASATIPTFAKTISIIRSRNISVSIILQSMSQLEGMYGKSDASTIINNCDHILYLGGHDLNTALFIGTHLNKTAHTALSLNRDEAILITQGESAQYVRKTPPYSELPMEVSSNHNPDDTYQTD